MFQMPFSEFLPKFKAAIIAEHKAIASEESHRQFAEAITKSDSLDEIVDLIWEETLFEMEVVCEIALKILRS